jgi:putative spermidine/putrescine transport system substrate-binding protein
LSHRIRRSGAVGVVLAVALAVLAGTGVAHPAAMTATAKSHGKVVFVGTGGTTQDAMVQTFFQPFSKKYGVTVDQGSIMTLALAQAQVQSGHPYFDVATVPQADYYAGLQQHLWAKINYKKYYSKQELKELPRAVRFWGGVGNITYGNGIVFNTNDFPANGPQPGSWADFWNVNKYPGKRGIPGCAYSVKTSLAEDALLADGVSPKHLYPLDIDRALNKIKELAPNAIFYSSSDSAISFTANGQESMALAPNGRVKVAVDQGAPLHYVWQGSRNTFDMWVILRNAPHMANAQKLVAYMSTPKPQADFAKLTTYGPTNLAAFKYLDANTAKDLASNPKIESETFQKNNLWWAAHGQDWVNACTATLGH